MSSKISLTVPQQQFPAINSPQRVSASSKGGLALPGSSGSTGRAKVALKPGRSLMDWVRLGKQQGIKLNGVQGQKMEVTEEELAKHNRIDDAWLAIRGQVYNVTPYMEFHPGGVEELARGIGKDATNLFNEVHRWVNVESMLEKCRIGPLKKVDPLMVFRQPGKKTSPKRAEVPTLHWPDTVEDIPWYMCKLRGKNNQVKAKHDWYQMGEHVVVSIYAKCQYFTRDHVIVDVSGRTLKVTMYLHSQYFILHLELPEEIYPNVKVSLPRASNPVRCDVWLKKKIPDKKWTTLGLPLDDHKKLAPVSDLDPCFRTCTLRKRVPVTHDTYLFTFDLPEGTAFRIPLGHHVYLKADVNGQEVSRPYTAVHSSLLEAEREKTEDTNSRSSVHLMIKIYPLGQFTQYLGTLKEGDEIEMSNHEGDLNCNCPSKKLSAMYLLAAGTGFTPMIRLIRTGLGKDSLCPLKLLFFNNTEKDIMWRDQLEKCAATSKGRFEVTHILSAQGASWMGHKGRIGKELVDELIPKPVDNKHVAFGICGPTPFLTLSFQLLLDAGFPEKCIHLFSA